MDKKNQQILVVSAIIMVVAIIVFGVLVLGKLERVVQVAERSERKLDRIIEAATPVGMAAVEKGVGMMESMDEEDLARSAEAGVKEVGALAKDKLLKWMDAQQPSPTNQPHHPARITRRIASGRAVRLRGRTANKGYPINLWITISRRIE